jgi:hypothetical protein
MQLVHRLSDTERRAFKVAYDQQYGGGGRRRGSSSARTPRHTIGYNEILESIRTRDLVSQGDLDSILSQFYFPNLADPSQRLNAIVAKTHEKQKGYGRVRLIASALAMSLFNTKMAELVTLGHHRNVAKSLACDQLRVSLSQLFSGEHGYVIKTMSALRFLKELSHNNMDILLVKSLTYKKLLKLNEYDKQCLKDGLRLGSDCWESLNAALRNVFILN